MEPDHLWQYQHSDGFWMPYRLNRSGFGVSSQVVIGSRAEMINRVLVGDVLRDAARDGRQVRLVKLTFQEVDI